MKSSPPERLLGYFSIAGLCVLAFIAGAAALYYRWPPGPFLGNAFNAATTWSQALSENDNDPIEVLDETVNELNESIIANPIMETWDKSRTYNGYTLVATGFMESAWLIDMQGKIVHRWDMPFLTAWPNPTQTHRLTNAQAFINCAYALPNGDLIAQYSAIGDTPYGYGLLKMDKNSKVLWTYNGNAHHDFYVQQKTGDIYALTHSMVTKPFKGLETLNYPTLADDIVRLSADGKELNRISIMEAFRDSPFALMLYHERNSGLAAWDHLHTNSITVLEPELASKFPMFKAGQIMISVRAMNAVAVIDPKTKKVVWAYSGPWKAQHAAHFLDNGHIVLFDNRGHYLKNRQTSRLIEFDPKTLEITWSYVATPTRNFNSPIIGRLQRLPNGNTLITESMKSQMFEITRDGNIVWSYRLQKAKRKDDTHNAIITGRRYRESDLPFLSKDVK